MRPLTNTQRRVLVAVNALSQARRYPPSLREIAEASGLASANSVHLHIRTLTALGLLAFESNTPRSVRLGPRVAGSRNGVLAEVVTVFSRCQPCGMDVPSTHVCPINALPAKGDRHAC